MKKFIKNLIVASILLTVSAIHAQYLVSVEEIGSPTADYVKQELENLGYNCDSMDINAITVYKITYNTTDINGDPTIASGALYVPQIDCDTLPLVSDQHPTEFNRSSVPSNYWYWEPGYLYSGNGFITTLPDYLGMGDNPGLHPYVHWESEATASIDLIRAAREFLNDFLLIWDNNQLFLSGYSQGGHSSMAVHKYIKTHNLLSEFNVVASAPMSGPFPIFDVQIPMMIGGDSSYYESEFIPYILASYQMVYGNLYENYNEYYDPPYDSIIPDWLASGTHDANEWAAMIPDNFYDFMQDSVLDNWKSNPNHPINIALRENDLHNWLPEEPVHMLYCGLDSMVFPQNSLMAQDTMIALGATDVQALDMDSNGIHETCWLLTYPYALEWFDSLRLECGEIANPSTSIPSVKKQPEIILYPNPVKDIATFSSTEITSFEIYDVMSAIIARRNANKIDMSNIPPGIYFVIGFDKNKHVLYKGKIIKN